MSSIETPMERRFSGRALAWFMLNHTHENASRQSETQRRLLSHGQGGSGQREPQRPFRHLGGGGRRRVAARRGRAGAADIGGLSGVRPNQSSRCKIKGFFLFLSV